MNNLISAVLIYSLAVTYFLLSNKTFYIYTLKYYSLFEHIYGDKNSLIILINHLLFYRKVIRYIRIHLTCSSIIITINFIIELPLTANLIKLSMTLVIIIAAYDILSLKTRLKALEDKLFRVYYNLNE